MRQNLFKLLGVTIAFAIGAVAIVGIVWVATAFEYGLEPSQGSVNWLGLTGQGVNFSVISGLIVDLVRFIGVVSWRPKPAYYLGTGKFSKNTIA